MELERQLGRLLDVSGAENALNELRATVPEGKGSLAVSLAEIAIAQGLLYVLSGSPISPFAQVPPTPFARVLPMPIPVSAEFVSATIVRYDTARTNPCLSLQNLPDPNPRWQDILLFAGDASKAQLLFQAEGSRDIAGDFFEIFESRLDMVLNKDQSNLHSFDVESGLIRLNAVFWRLALDVSLGEKNGGQPSTHFDDSLKRLQVREPLSPLVQAIVSALQLGG